MRRMRISCGRCRASHHMTPAPTTAPTTNDTRIQAQSVTLRSVARGVARAVVHYTRAVSNERGRPSHGLTGVYLRPLEDDLVPARHSAGARTRARQLQAFLRPLHEVAAPVLEPEGAMTLIVAGSSDWRRLCNYPYGLPFTRNGPKGTSAAIMAAADYQPRFVRRFDEMLLEAGRAGLRAPAHIGEFVDLMVGHEWGHAVANLSGLRTRVRWLDELIASYMFVAALHATEQTEMLTRLREWTELQVAGTTAFRGDLADFEYPRTRAGWGLAPTRGWEFPLELCAAMPVAHRGELARSLVAVEPSFKPWFAVFGTPKE